MSFWIALAVAAALIFSGLSWLRPSPMEKRQMNARQGARKLGLVPQVRPLSEWAKARHDQAMVPFYALAGGVGEAHFSVWLSGQQWVGQADASGSHKAADELADWLARAPENVLGIDANASQIGAWWAHERESELQSLKDWLSSCPRRKGTPI